MRVREWARREGFNEQTVWQWCRENRMPVPFERMNTGTIIIHDPKYENQPAAPTANGRTVCYARVSSSDQKDDLQRQADRLKAFAINMGVKSPEVVTETGSGMNDKRRKLNRLLADPTVGTLIVEHRQARPHERGTGGERVEGAGTPNHRGGRHGTGRRLGARHDRGADLVLRTTVRASRGQAQDGRGVEGGA